MTRKRGFRKPIVPASLTGEAAQTLLAEAARIAERYDLANMSTKGMSVTASRTLVEDLCGKRGLQLLVLHDFDVSGFSIKQTMVASNRRYSFRHAINFIDLGWRLADVEEMGLDAQPTMNKGDDDKIAERLTTTHEVRHRCECHAQRRQAHEIAHPATLHRNLYALTPNSPWVGRVPMGLNEKRPSARGALGRSSFCNDHAELGDEPSTPAPQRAEEGELNARQT